MKETEQTPLMKQYWGLKEESGIATLLFFRMGDFYELFGDDAKTASRILGITLTSRDRKSDNPLPMAGVPFHSAQNYIQKCLNLGYKVAIAEQIGDPSETAKGVATPGAPKIVERKIVRVFTPAVQFEISGAEGAGEFALAIVMPDTNLSGQFRMAHFSASTGQSWVSEAMTETALMKDTTWRRVKHFLHPMGRLPLSLVSAVQSMDGVLVEEVAPNLVTEKEATDYLKRQFEVLALPPLLDTPTARHTLAILIQYVCKTQNIDRLTHLAPPKPLHLAKGLRFGPRTLEHLDADEFFAFLNSCSTSMGTRTLREHFLSPMTSVAEISARQSTLQDWNSSSRRRETWSSKLKEIYDLDRLLGRLATKLANPRDTLAIGKSLAVVRELAESVTSGAGAMFTAPELFAALSRLNSALDLLAPMCERIQKTQKPEAPFHTRDGGIFEMGTHPELDLWIQLSENGEKALIDLEIREREATGISSLKVKYNRVFGYFIEISSSNLKHAPAHYQRKQTMVGGERFFTEELKEFEEKMLSAVSKRRALEQDLFEQLVLDLIECSPELKVVSEILGFLDATLALSQFNDRQGWCVPAIAESREFSVIDNRHPVLDGLLMGKFIPNSFTMNGISERIFLITGPNMGGKSTIMRQVALTIWLGQMGAAVPAREAHWGVFDSIYTRIGAHDALSQGQSTFMVEMTELADILAQCSERSFIVLDEIGRGTSTYDGMSVAWATIEHFAAKTQARVLFATHYHELTELQSTHPEIRNFHMEVHERKGGLDFTYQFKPGPAERSFGVQVAKLAGLPDSVTKRAWSILKKLESERALSDGFNANQMGLFELAPSIVETVEVPEILPPEISGLKNDLESLNLDDLKPIEALQWLYGAKAKLK